MPPEQFYWPSDRMTKRYGVDAWRHAQDLTVYVRRPGGFTAAVVDGANNFIGQTQWPEGRIAASRGLDSAMLNGGEIVASLLAETVRRYPDVTGTALIRLLNEEIARQYEMIGLIPDLSNRGTLFTGYLAHVHVAHPVTTITVVGDCSVAINGRVIVGGEKEIDRLYAGIIDSATQFLGWDRQRVYTALMPTSFNVRQFDFQNYKDMKWSEVEDFRRWLVAETARLLPISLEDARGIVQPLLENNYHPVWYPAIDGTHTPSIGVYVDYLMTAAIRRIIMFTDGYRPIADGHDVNSIDDLVATNAEFSERAAVVITAA